MNKQAIEQSEPLTTVTSAQADPPPPVTTTTDAPGGPWDTSTAGPAPARAVRVDLSREGYA